MPNFNKPAAGRDQKKSYKPAGAPKAGSRSEGHRGYRPDVPSAAPKKRWTSDDRAARSGDAPRGAG
ncbi:MAG: hypothetical protein EPN91_05035, partial [Salinibacterium sp.]